MQGFVLKFVASFCKFIQIKFPTKKEELNNAHTSISLLAEFNDLINIVYEALNVAIILLFYIM